MAYFTDRGYCLPHFRLSTYSVGMAVGLILASNKHICVSKKTNVALWMTSIVVGFSVIFSTYIWNSSLEKPGMISSVLYASTHRCFWTLALAWITIHCQLINIKGLLSRFLGSETFVPFSRITFMVYLIHMVIINYYYGTARKTTTYDFKTLIFLFWGILSFSFILATILTLFFESPFLRLQRDFMKSMSKKREIEKL